MNKRFHANQHVLSTLAFRFVIVLLFCSAAIAQQQLKPNPNPLDNTINVFFPADNLEWFLNWGTIDNWPCGAINNWPWGTIENNGNIDNQGIIGNCGAIDNMGTIDNEHIMYNVLSGTIDNQGIIQNDLWGWIENSAAIDNTGTIDNLGLIDNRGGTIDNFGAINNEGIIYNDFWGIINNNAPGTIYNYGTYGVIINDGTWNNDGTFNNEGTFAGTGTFIGNLKTLSGTLAPGSSAGTMTIDGDYTLGGTGTLEIEIGGFTPGSFDVLDITGTAYLTGGNINFSFLPGYDIVTDVGPTQSWELSFLNAGSIDSFNSVITYNFMSLPYFQFNVFQHDTELVFQATNTVPLPGAVILGSIGLAFASWKLRRRKEL